MAIHGVTWHFHSREDLILLHLGGSSVNIVGSLNTLSSCSHDIHIPTSTPSGALMSLIHVLFYFDIHTHPLKKNKKKQGGCQNSHLSQPNTLISSTFLSQHHTSTTHSLMSNLFIPSSLPFQTKQLTSTHKNQRTTLHIMQKNTPLIKKMPAGGEEQHPLIFSQVQ